MKKKLLLAFKHPLISGTIVIFGGTLIANIFNFFFNLFMASRLSIADYGVLASLISLLTLPAYAANAIVPAVVQFGGIYFSENDLASVGNLYKKAGGFVLSIALLIFIIFILFLNEISAFVKIYDVYLLLMTDIVIFIGFLLFLHVALLQAKLSFGFIAFTNFTGAMVKLLLGIILVMLGFRTHGAIAAILIATLFPFLLTFIPLRFLFNFKVPSKKIKSKELLTYGLPSAVGLLSLTSFITSDILLVKHFFSAQVAGTYAGLSLMGRVVFYFTAPIATVMFPLIVRKHNKREKYTGTFLLAILFVAVASLTITIVYHLFPEAVVLTFVRRTEYLSIAPLLSLFALYITIFSVTSILVNFYFSIKSTSVFVFILLGALMQILLIYFYHSTLQEVIIISLVILLLLLIILLLYYPYATKKK